MAPFTTFHSSFSSTSNDQQANKATNNIINNNSTSSFAAPEFLTNEARFRASSSKSVPQSQSRFQSQSHSHSSSPSAFQHYPFTLGVAQAQSSIEDSSPASPPASNLTSLARRSTLNHPSRLFSGDLPHPLTESGAVFPTSASKFPYSSSASLLFPSSVDEPASSVYVSNHLPPIRDHTNTFVILRQPALERARLQSAQLHARLAALRSILFNNKELPIESTKPTITRFFRTVDTTSNSSRNNGRDNTIIDDSSNTVPDTKPHTTTYFSTRAREQTIVPWQPDVAVNRCVYCDQPFSFYTLRKHHCRICGLVVCADRLRKCSDLFYPDGPSESFSVPSTEQSQSQPLPESRSQSQSQSSAFALSFYSTSSPTSVRICCRCSSTLFGRSEFDQDCAASRLDQRAYEHLREFQKGIQILMPRFQQLLSCLQYDVPDSNVVTQATRVRRRLMDAFTQYDIAARRIRDLPTSSRTQARLQNRVYQHASAFLHVHMLPLNSIPASLGGRGNDAGDVWGSGDLKHSQAPSLDKTGVYPGTGKCTNSDYEQSRSRSCSSSSISSREHTHDGITPREYDRAIISAEVDCVQTRAIDVDSGQDAHDGTRVLSSRTRSTNPAHASAASGERARNSVISRVATRRIASSSSQTNQTPISTHSSPLNHRTAQDNANSSLYSNTDLLRSPQQRQQQQQRKHLELERPEEQQKGRPEQHQQANENAINSKLNDDDHQQTIEILKEQQTIVSLAIAHATAAGQFDDVSALSVNFDDLASEIERLSSARTPC